MPVFLGFPGGSDGKKLPVMQEFRVQPLGWEDPLAMGTPTLVFFPGEFHEHKSLSGYNAWNPKELDTTEQFSLSWGKHTSFPDRSRVPPIRHMLTPSHICIGPKWETSLGKASAYNAGHPGWIPGFGISPEK